MKIIKVEPAENYTLHIISEDGKTGVFDVTPYLDLEAFQELNNPENFNKITNGGYFVEWDCGADLSADTIDAHLKPFDYKSAGRKFEPFQTHHLFPYFSLSCIIFNAGPTDYKSGGEDSISPKINRV